MQENGASGRSRHGRHFYGGCPGRAGTAEFGRALPESTRPRKSRVLPLLRWTLGVRTVVRKTTGETNMGTGGIKRRLVTVAVAVAMMAGLVGPAVAARATSGPHSKTFYPQPKTEAPPAPNPVDTQRFSITASDGTPLSVSLFTRDMEPGHRYPVILMMGPNFDHAVWDVHPTFGSYYSAPEQCKDLSDPNHQPCVVGEFTAYGYAVAHVSMRGMGQSGGQWNYWGPKDASDFRDVVRWFASPPADPNLKLPLFGKVGALGMSAEANELVAGISRPKDVPALPLATSVIIQGVTSMYDEYAHDGAAFVDANYAPRDYLALEAGPRWDPNDVPGSVVADPTGNLGRTPGDAVASAGDINASIQPDGLMSDYYRDRDYKRFAENIDMPVLDVQGTTDEDVLPVNLSDWWDAIPTFKRLVLPRFSHVYPPADEADYPWWPMLHAWFDHWLLGYDTGVESWPVVQVERRADGDDTVVTHRYRAVDSFDDLSVASKTVAFGATGDSFGEGAPALTIPLGPATASLHLAGHATIRLALSHISAVPANIQVDLQETSGSGDTYPAHVVSFFCRYQPDRLSSKQPDHCHTVGRRGAPPVIEIDSATFERVVPDGKTLQLVIRGLPDMVRDLKDANVQIVPARSGYVATLDPGRSTIALPLANEGTPLCIGRSECGQ